MLTRNLGSLPKGRHLTALVSFPVEINTREVFMSDIVKVCKIHGDLNKYQVYFNKNGKYIYPACKKCSLLRNRSYEKRNPDKIKEIRAKGYYKRFEKERLKSILRLHKISYEKYIELLQSQNEKCAICFKKETKTIKGNRVPRPLHLDHDHKTGKTREFLCQNCNLGLGHFCDDPYSLENAAKYIRKHSCD
jgi:hypothetical protein